jgi:hypothetical protein
MGSRKPQTPAAWTNARRGVVHDRAPFEGLSAGRVRQGVKPGTRIGMSALGWPKLKAEDYLSRRLTDRTNVRGSRRASRINLSISVDRF